MWKINSYVRGVISTRLFCKPYLKAFRWKYVRAGYVVWNLKQKSISFIKYLEDCTYLL
jgi:hypothetical protein